MAALLFSAEGGEELQSFITVGDYATANITEKRSKFIAHVYHIESEEQAAELIAEVRKKYWDARHNVYAYALREGNIKKYSDDSEPHGTAGPPVLDAIIAADVTDVLVVVTRYFGGILLGTGGLVRAYTDSAAAGLAAAEKIQRKLNNIAATSCDYGDFGRLQTIIAAAEGSIIRSDFADNVSVELAVPCDKWEQFCKKIEEAFSARLEISEICVKYC